MSQNAKTTPVHADYTQIDDPLGLILNGTSATFKLWAPLATQATLLLYTDASKIGNFRPETVAAQASGSCDEPELRGEPAQTVPMTANPQTGVWLAENVDVSSYTYYKFEIVNGGITYYVCDLWNGVAAPDSIASQIISIDDPSAQPAHWEQGYTNPFGKNGVETKTYNDAVIYEMHVRDWSRAVNPASTGKFGELASDTIIAHLKDLGVTHVQLLPIFDHAQVNSDKNYNWGYNPYHYNTPEGRYVTEGYTNGTQAVKELRELIAALHKAGIAVIMDVVYNHTSGIKGGSLYDSTVPGYFYRTAPDGTYIDGSGCGNSVASEHPMVQRYIRQSLIHWVKDYHINGFRFDLMGCLDNKTMQLVYDDLHKIDPNILVYGEPWTAGATGLPATAEATAAGKGTEGYGYGAFDDDFRDAIKGADFCGIQLGQLQGTYADEIIEGGLTGAPIAKNRRNETGITGLALHYVECHDNYTLFDKLVYSTIYPLTGECAPQFAAACETVLGDEAQHSLIKKQVKLAGAYILLSQGTPFMNGGQEFMRSKKGNPDSYSADTKGGISWTNTPGEHNIDDVNTIDLSLKEKNKDVYNTYKALIALRKAHNAFRNAQSAEAHSPQKGVTVYTATSGAETFTVIFNATSSDYEGEPVFGKRVSINEACGTFSLASTAEPVSTVPAKSFVIIKR